MGLITDRLKKQQELTGVFLCLAGPRFGGKTTTLGTLKGKTLLIDISDKESGSRGAVNMATKLGVDTFDVVTGLECKDVAELVEEAVTLGYDNIAIDGLSALSEIEEESAAVKRAAKSDKWGGWALMGKNLIGLLSYLKGVSIGSGVNIIITVALKEKTNAEGEVTSTDLDLRGNIAKGFLTGKCPYFVVSRLASDKEGKPLRILQTYSDGVYEGRLDGIFDGNNPKAFRSDPERVEEGEPVGLDALLTYLKKR
jgi:hypothetical protein